jgi:hypothetical protein
VNDLSGGNLLWRYMRVWTSGLLQTLELSILRLRGVKLFVIYQGDDVRQGDYCLANYDITFASEVPPGYYTSSGDSRKRRQVQVYQKYGAKFLALNPDLLNVLPVGSQFLPYFHQPKYSPTPTSKKGDTLRVGHAPTNRLVKGTKFLLDAIDRLKRNGFSIDLVLIENMEHAKVQEVMKEGMDVFVDQLLAGWYGVAAVEAMSLGIPSVCYIREEDLCHLPDEMKASLPIVRSTPTEIYETLLGIINMSETEIMELKNRAIDFSERWHSTTFHYDNLNKLVI